MTPLLELRGILVRVPSTVILDIPTLTLASGETLAILGANGAGKSTLLRVAGALLTPDHGMLLLDGQPATEHAIRRSCSAVLQRPLLRRGSVLTNATTGLRFHGYRRKQAQQHVQPWLERLGIATLAHRSATTLSGGEAQRVSLARALALQPRLLLLDEPFNSLDTPTKGELLADLRDLLASQQTGVLFVTHDRHEAAALANNTALLHNGRIHQHGPTPDTLENPTTDIAAKLLGFQNILHHNNQTLALRPSDLTPRPPHHPDAPHHTRLTATLERTVPHDDQLALHCTHNNQRLTALVHPPQPEWLDILRPGQPLTLTFDPQHAKQITTHTR